MPETESEAFIISIKSFLRQITFSEGKYLGKYNLRKRIEYTVKKDSMPGFLSLYFKVGESMTKEGFRESGIDSVRDLVWGTHFCQLYHKKEDLIDIVIPFLKAGLENNEFCIWIVSNSLEAKKVLKKFVPDLEMYLEKRQIEIIPYNDWYLKPGFFDPQEVLNRWIEKLNRALSSGYEGLRLTEVVFSLEEEYRDDFAEYEKEIDRVIGNYKIVALCTYPLSEYSSSEIIDIITDHQFTLVKKEGKWEKIKSSR